MKPPLASLRGTRGKTNIVDIRQALRDGIPWLEVLPCRLEQFNDTFLPEISLTIKPLGRRIGPLHAVEERLDSSF